MKHKILSLLLATWMLCAAFLATAISVKAPNNFDNSLTRIYLNSNNYPGSVPSNWFAPGDNITGWIEGRGLPDTEEDIIDVVAADDDPGTPGCDNFLFADIRLSVDNVAIDGTTGRGVFSFPGSTTQYLSDGRYCAWTAPRDYLENSGAPGHYNRVASFEIHLYRIDASTNRGGYIPGDTVKVFYQVSKIKDGSLVSDSEFTSTPQREWMVQSTDSLTVRWSTLSGPSGSFDYTIINNGGVNPMVTYPTRIWYNGTTGGAARAAVWNTNVPVGNLVANIDSLTPTPPLIPGTLLEVDMSVYVTPSGAAYPNATVVVRVLNGPSTTSPQMPGYGGTFYSDASGRVVYPFILKESDFLEGRIYTITMNATSILKFDTDSTSFDIRKVPGPIAVEMEFDKLEYYSDEVATITVYAEPPAGHSQPSTYVYRVYSGSVIFTIRTLTTNTFTFHIPANFQGPLTFRVDVYNDDGDYGWDAESKYINWGIMIINVSPLLYQPNDVITVNFELKSTVMTSPLFYYKVFNDDTGEVMIQTQITVSGKAGSFTYTVPTIPASVYGFEVWATEDGHLVKNTVYAGRIQGYYMTISFDKTSYMPGETITVTYTISARVAGTPMPSVYYLTYYLWNTPSNSLQTTEASGTVQYVVPGNANEGDVLFTLYEGRTGTSATEVLFIGQKLEIGGVEIFDAFLLVLIVILFLLVLAFRFRGPAAAGPAKVKEEKPAPPPPGQQASPMIVNCKSCGAPIEITTSKRPIEVMCPSCGETEMVQ